MIETSYSTIKFHNYRRCFFLREFKEVKILGISGRHIGFDEYFRVALKYKLYRNQRLQSTPNRST